MNLKDVSQKVGQVKISDASTKEYTIVVESRGKSKEVTGTLSYLVDYFEYVLDKGKSWEDEKGNKKINLTPKTADSLVTNLNNSEDNSALGGKGSTSYKLKEVVKDTTKMNNLDWGKTTKERNDNQEHYNSLKTEKEKTAFLKKLKSKVSDSITPKNKLSKRTFLSSTEYKKFKDIKGFNPDNWKWNEDDKLYVRVSDSKSGANLSTEQKLALALQQLIEYSDNELIIINGYELNVIDELEKLQDVAFEEITDSKEIVLVCIPYTEAVKLKDLSPLEEEVMESYRDQFDDEEDLDHELGMYGKEEDGKYYVENYIEGGYSEFPSRFVIRTEEA